jgi:hypothetical protein
MEVAENKCVQQLFLNDIKIKVKEKIRCSLKYLALQKPYYLNNSRGMLVSTLLAYYYAVIYRR